MSERLAIAPPPAENELPSSDRDEILVGKIVSPGHEGLQGAVDATPGAGYELPREEVNTSGEPTSESMFREAAQNFIPEEMRDRDPLNPIQDYERRIMDDAREHFTKNPLHEPEREGQEQVAPIDLRAVLKSYFETYVEGVMPSPEDPFRKLYSDLPGEIQSLSERLQSPRAHERAAATNKLTDVVIGAFKEKEFSAEERFDCYAFAPDQARSFLHNLGSILYMSVDHRSEHGEALTNEERDVAQLILQFGHDATLEAEKQDVLLDGATLLGSAAEKSFADHLTSGYEDKAEAIRQRELVHRTYEKLRFRAIRHLENQKRNAEYGLAA